MIGDSGLEGVFFCAGARNQLLLDKFSPYPLSMEVDERIASFKALGLSKATNNISIVCTTSGTAVSECLSAMVEAYYSESKLLLITADRPRKLQDTGAPQTIDHEVITRGFRKAYFDMTLDEFDNLDLASLKFPAHLNIRITSADEGKTIPVWEFSSFESFMRHCQRPLFLFSHENKSMRCLVQKFLSYGLPFYAEVSSGAKDLSPIKSEKELLSLFNKKTFDGIVRIGHTPLSKLWRILEGLEIPVYSFDSRGLKGLSHGTVENLSVAQLQTRNEFWECLPKRSISFQYETCSRLSILCEKYPNAEISIIKKIHDLIPEGSKVFLGNSLPIRYFELVQTKPFEIMACRGVNGIDGQIATAQGWCLSTEETVYCILGDMTFSYDLGSLLNFPSNLKCIVINNSGGRIFEVLKMDSRLVMEHGRSFRKISEGFNLKYTNSLNELPNAQILEISPLQVESRQFLEEWNL